MRGDSAEILFFFLQEAIVQFWHGQRCPRFDGIHLEFPLPTTAPPTFLGALKHALGEAVVACDMPEPCKFPSLDSCQMRFLLTHKEVDLTPHPVVGLVLPSRRYGEVSLWKQGDHPVYLLPLTYPASSSMRTIELMNARQQRGNSDGTWQTRRQAANVRC